MAVHRRSSRTRNVLAVLVLAALTLVTVDARSNGGGSLSDIRRYTRDAFSPLQRATHATLDPIGNFLTGALDYGSLRHENQRLRAQIAQMSNAAAQARAEGQSAEQIEAQQHLAFLGGIGHITASVIDNGFSNFDVSLTISKGTSAGVAVGQPVVASDGLVGLVEYASQTTATVRLLTDPAFKVGVDLQGNNVGTAAGQGQTQPFRISVDTNCLTQPVQQAGDVLVTSGLAMEAFPKGIPVARVTKFTKQPGSIEPNIEAVPVVNTSSLQYVQVLEWSSQGTSSAADGPSAGSGCPSTPAR